VVDFPFPRCESLVLVWPFSGVGVLLLLDCSLILEAGLVSVLLLPLSAAADLLGVLLEDLLLPEGWALAV
jgi:hypothetical protein